MFQFIICFHQYRLLYKEDMYDRVENAESLQELLIYLSAPFLRARIRVNPAAEIPELADFSEIIEKNCETVVTDTVLSVDILVWDTESGSAVAEKVF